MGKTCHAYSASPSGVGMVNGVTWPLENPNCSASLISCQNSELILWAYRALSSSVPSKDSDNHRWIHNYNR